jgi:hypothetical protein
VTRAAWTPRPRAMTPAAALVAVLALVAALLGSSAASLSATSGAASAATVTPKAAVGTTNYGPAPWWQGDCDATHWRKSAAALGWDGVGSHPLGASYLGIEVCGPRPSVDGSPNVLWSRAGWGESEWQCVELAQRFMAQVYGTKAYQANGADVVSHYNAATVGGGLVKIANGTVGVAPMPGDIVSFRTTKNPYGHVTVVVRTSIDATGTGTVTMLSQNDSPDGWRTLPITQWRLGNQNTLVPYGWLHDPLGRGNPLGEGSFIRVKGSTTIYRIAGGAPVIVISWPQFGGSQKITEIEQAQFDKLGRYPADGTYVQDLVNNNVYRMAGGSPLLVSAADQPKMPLWGTASVIGLDHNAFLRHDHLRTVPYDRTQLYRVDTRQYYVVAGGAPMLVPSTDTAQVGTWQSKRTISVSGAEFTAYTSLRARPSDGTFLCDGSGTACYRVAGGSPLLLGAKDPAVPGFSRTTAIRVPHYEFAHYVHLAAHPADGTVLCPVGEKTCYVVAGHAPLAIAPSSTPAVATSHGILVARTELLHPAHLAARPVDGTVLRTQKGSTYVVRGGVAHLQPATTTAASTTPAVTVDQAAIDNAGVKGAWAHLLSAPPAMHFAAPKLAVTFALRTTVSWVAPVASSVVTSYDVRSRRSYATGTASAWTTGWTSTPSTWVRAVLGVGYSTCFSVRAHNRAGQVGPWSPTVCTARPLDDRGASVLSLGWKKTTSASAYGGTLLTTTTHKAVWRLDRATFTRLGVLAATSPTGGSLQVLVNGKVAGRLSLVSATPVAQRYLELPRLPLTTGSIQLVVTSATGRTVQLDGVVVSRT